MRYSIGATVPNRVMMAVAETAAVAHRRGREFEEGGAPVVTIQAEDDTDYGVAEFGLAVEAGRPV